MSKAQQMDGSRSDRATLLLLSLRLCDLRSGDSGSVFVPSNLNPVVLLAQKDWADVLLYSFRAEKGV